MQKELTVRIVRFGTAGTGVSAARLWANLNLQLGVAGPEPPPIRDSVIGTQLPAVSFGFLPVVQHERKGRGRIDLFHAANVVVVVVESRQREGKTRVRLNAVSQFVRDEFFRIKISPAGEQEWR